MARPSTDKTAAKRVHPEPPRDTSRELLVAIATSRRLAPERRDARPAPRADHLKLVSITHPRARLSPTILDLYVSYYDNCKIKYYICIGRRRGDLEDKKSKSVVRALTSCPAGRRRRHRARCQAAAHSCARCELTIVVFPFYFSSEVVAGTASPPHRRAGGVVGEAGQVTYG
ncbi:unnamed protein product [Euphydryas editha]|uniref:Uncharacterized protein n=1 Tax=Euphydryas editha TaxID=104508 RepID=A0AAU9TXD8_EUPED|nr:unnamed protein product [Euphydryas editha]